MAAEGDDARARALEEESAAICRKTGDHWSLASPLGYLGYLDLRQGDFEAAQSHFEESLNIMKELGNQWHVAWRLEGFAGLAARNGQKERAAKLFGAAQAMLEAIRATFVAGDRLDYDHHISLARTQLGEEAFQAAWAEGRTMTLEQAVAYALEESSSGLPSA